jgi:hypothetical protein
MGVANERSQVSGEYRSNVTPTSKDSARYRGGFEQGLKGMKGLPNEGTVEKMGRWEGQNVSKKAPKKSRMGSKVKKAQMGATMPKPSEGPKKSKSASMKPTKIVGMKMGGTLAPTKKSVGKTIGKLNKAKSGMKMSKMMSKMSKKK